MLSYLKIKEIIPAFNERPLTDADFFFLTDTNRIEVNEIKIKKRGYHVWEDGEDFIFIRKTLRGLKWLETAFHELFHAVLQIPTRYWRHYKQQIEANAFALIALIPAPMLRGLAFLEEHPTIYAHYLFKERKRVFDLYGI